ncbi:hypothetical protein LJR251_005925 [Rhizobium rhizogenes]|uniref:hypothetical protein n=1 Tax=Rhizobium rhizogenes TaxID=359 RepID=UPI003ECFA823
MDFAELFAAAMGERGVTVDPFSTPDASIIEDSIGRIWFWLSELDPAVSSGIDEASGEFAICHTLAGSELNVAPDFLPILQAYDQTAGQTLTGLLTVTDESLQQALQGGGQV